MRSRILLSPARLAFAMFCIIAIGAAWGLFSRREPPSVTAHTDPDVRARTKPDSLAAQFVGSRVCARCHQTEFHDQTASNHAHTLRHMQRDRLPKGFPHTARFIDAETGLHYELTEDYGIFTLAVQTHRGVERSEIDFALGSGAGPMTFISRASPTTLVELRASYFPTKRQWFVTPGQRGPDADPVGVRHEAVLAQRCLACHSTVLPASQIAPEERFMGVGCEACHGPGNAHVAAMRQGGAPASIEGFRGWGAKRLNYLCGECHRTAQDVDPHSAVAVSQTQRLQPYGLMKSACFLKSGDRLSCLTCHNPHRNAERAPQSYERACLSCHGPTAGSKACPVDRRGGCVGCHMPQRELLPGFGMADHWIRVYPRRNNS